MYARADQKQVFFISLGCDKNLVDSEKMLGLISRGGYVITDDETAADVIVVNTCCFINDAKEESIQAILDMAKLKESGSCRALIVTGCLAQRYRQEILQEIPEVDAVIGTSAWDELIRVIEELTRQTVNSSKTACNLRVTDSDRNPSSDAGRLLTTGGHYAYLKIAEGCDKRCTYCIIPYIRGRYRSFPMEELVAEARELADGGVRELILVAQETTLYGTDLYGKKSLHLLVRELARIPGIRWIRLLYCYPEEIYDELIEVMRTEEKVCHYLDLPVQHADDQILRRMGRKTNRKQLETLIRKLREQIPDIILRTTLITGFPGETRKAHETLLEFIDEMEFDRLGAFAYSPEEGTPAAGMEDQVPEEVKLERLDEIMSLQQEIAFDLAGRRVGQKLWVMVEGRITGEMDEAEENAWAGEAPEAEETAWAGEAPEAEETAWAGEAPEAEGGNVYVCRTYGDAPDVDGYLFLRTEENLMSGDFVYVQVTGAREYDLVGEIVEA